MKSPSKQKLKSKSLVEKRIKQTVNNQLDESVEQLNQMALADIAHVRMNALSQVNQPTSKERFYRFFYNPIKNVTSELTLSKLFTLAIPTAAAVVLTVLVTFTSVESIPQLPIALMNVDIPIEDLALLENLEFVAT